MNQINNETKQSITSRNLLLILLMFVASSIFVSCLPGKPSEEALAAMPDEKVFNVRAAEAVVGNLEDRITLSGEVYATGRVNVVPDTSGLLTKVLVNPGDTVSFNQIIAYVDPSRPGMSYAESPVRSKATGTVTAVPAIPGNQVSAQSVIAEVGNLEHLEIETKVPEKYLASLRSGLQGWVSSRAFPDSQQSAQVSEVSPVVDPSSRTVKITLVPDSTDKLRPGQAVQVELVLRTRENILSVPASAVTERRDGKGVFVIDGDIASWRLLSVGENVAGFIEVIEGLNPGAQVIVAGYEELTDGTPIRVLEIQG